MTGITAIRNGRVVTPTGVIDGGHVVVAGDRIARVSRTPSHMVPESAAIDANGRVVLPGLVDLHGDDIEHHRSPRSGATVDLRTALTVADRTNLFSGVTTKFHAVAFEDAPAEGRGLETAKSIAGELERESYTLGDNRLHARCELTEASVRAVEEIAERVTVDLLSVMHHVPGEGQYDEDSFERHYVGDRNWSAAAVEAAAAERGSITPEARRVLIERVTDLATQADVPLASHDDECAAAVEEMADYGVTISEYPLALDAARQATELGLDTVLGAPNLVRGGSLWDNLNVRTAIDRGLVDVLCADYHPPSLLAAPFVETGESLPIRVNRVTRNPAAVAGLDDRGRIEEGARADLIVVDPDPTPTVDRVFVAGNEVARTGVQPQQATPPEPASGS